MLIFNFDLDFVNRQLSVDKSFQGSPVQPRFTDLFPVLVPATEKEEKYRRTTLPMVDKRALRTPFYHS
jgi:hypothetical protein